MRLGKNTGIRRNKHLSQVVSKGITTLRKYFNKLFILVAKIVLVSIFKIIGRPRILQFGWPLNAAILRAFGAKAGKTQSSEAGQWLIVMFLTIVLLPVCRLSW